MQLYDLKNKRKQSKKKKYEEFCPENVYINNCIAHRIFILWGEEC